MTDAMAPSTNVQTDITEREQLEADLHLLNVYLEDIVADRTAQLHASEARYRQLVESASEVFYQVAVTDDPLTGHMEFVSPSVTAVTGRLPDEFIQDPALWMKSVHPDDLDSLAESTRAAYVDLKPVTRSYRIRNLDGRYRWMEDKIRIVVDGRGRAVGYSGVARDVTERRHLEAQLLQSHRMDSVGRLAGGIAHDFNNLLTVIIGVIDVALANQTEESPLYADLKEVRRAGQRAAALTRQLLAFSRRQVLQPRVLDLNTVLADMLSMLRRLLIEDITVVFMPSGLGLVKADPAQLEQVIVNLAVNARDAMPTGGTLTIETRELFLDEMFAAEHPSVQPGPHVMLSIGDTGVGMDDTTCQRIFEPFFTTKAPGQGTGLGLSMVYGIVKQSGGSIWVSSEIGRGSTFRIYLPLAKGIAHTNPRGPAAHASPGSETILLVEDEDVLRRLVTRILQSSGYTVLAAANGDEAIQLLEQHADAVRLMLTDVVMPGLSARELVLRVSARYPAMRVIFTSGYVNDATAQHGLVDEAAHFLAKPYTVAELMRKLREVLDS